ncbi:MAG: tRNA threonylcarbamoyladenosine dehydratase [Culicoidibacterales bacterium]
MVYQFSRNELAIGVEGVNLLAKMTVVVLGIGGVGSFAAEALARSGVGTIVLFDEDVVDITNINRQIHALTTTIGQQKCEVMKQRISEINPNCHVIANNKFINRDCLDLMFEQNPDFIIDSVDTVMIKCLIVKEAIIRGVPIISSMGVANKMDPTQLKIASIWKTSYDPIARIIRKDLRSERMPKAKLMVVYSEERPLIPKAEIVAKIGDPFSLVRKKQIPPASNAYVPSVAGLFCASHVVNQLLLISEITFNRKE